MRDPLKESFDRFVVTAKDGNTFSRSAREELVRSRTTILAMKFNLKVKKSKDKDAETFEVPAVMIASDGRTTAYRVESDDSKKIRLVDEYTAIGTSGVCFLVHKLAKYLQLLVHHHDDNVDPADQRLTLRSKVDMLGHVVGQFVESVWPMGFVLVGYEPTENRCRIFSVGSDGFAIDKGNFGGNGSGYEPVIGTLESYAGKTYTGRRVINVMKKILAVALKHDPYSGGTCRGIIITPIGYKEVDLNA